MRAEDAGEDIAPATAMTPIDGFNRPPDQTNALVQRSTMEGIAAVRFELEAMVARAEQRPRDEFQALEKMRTASRGRLLTGRIDASVLTSIALPSGRAICRA